MTTTATSTRKLGKLAVRIDVRTLRFSRYVDRAELPAPPEALDLTDHVADWPMYANDRIGDCTIAAAGHMIEAWTAESGGRAAEVTERSVLDAFGHVKQIDPLSGEAGAVVLDVLRYWRRDGIGRHRIGAYTEVPLHDHDLVEVASWLFGGLYVGVDLPLTAQGQPVWDWTGSLDGPAKPGSWGGHAVDLVRYGEDGVTVVSWGRLQSLTWEFWDRYCDEVYAILSRDFLAHGRAPNGFDLPALRTDLKLVTA
jgi:hypothetical protein